MIVAAGTLSYTIVTQPRTDEGRRRVRLDRGRGCQVFRKSRRGRFRRRERASLSTVKGSRKHDICKDSRPSPWCPRLQLDIRDSLPHHGHVTMPQESPRTDTFDELPDAVPPVSSRRGGSVSGVLALVIFGTGLATFVVGVLRSLESVPSPRPKAQVADVEVAETPPPSPTEDIPSDLTPSLRDQLALLLHGVRGDPSDADAHGELGLFYEAYGFRSFALRAYATAVSTEPESPRWKYHWAVVASAGHESDAAVAAMRFVCKSEPEFAPAHERLGLMLVNRNDFDAAMEVFHKLVALVPDSAAGYVGRGRVLLATGQVEDAVSQFRLALARDASSGKAHYLLGQAYQRLGRVDEARTELARGARSQTELLPDPWRATMLTALSGSKARLSYARYLREEGRLDEAVDMLFDLNRLSRADIDIANALGSTLLELGRSDEAAEVLTAALDAPFQSYLTHCHLANAHIELGDLDAALQHAEAATVIAPMTAWGFFTKGQVLYRQKQYEAALVAYRRAVELDPRKPNGYGRIGLTLALLDRHDEAVGPLETAVELAPHSPVPLYNLGVIHAQARRFGKAARVLRSAALLDPQNKDVMNALNRVERKVGRP